MALSDHTMVAAYALTYGIKDLQESYDGYSAQNMSFIADGDLGGLPVADFSSSYYGIDNALQNGFDTEYTISMWLKPDAISGTDVILANEQHGSYYNTFCVALQANGEFWIMVRSANGGSYDTAYSGASIPVGEWSHVVITWSGSEIKWYIDGDLTSTTAASRVPWNSPATMWIGGNATKADKQYFDGKISDLRFYYSEFTASDVSDLYAAGQVPIDLGLRGKYDLDSDAVDSVGSFDGTANNITFGTASGRSYAELNGTNSEILLDQSVGDLWASNVSWSMWFKTSATAPAEGDFLYMVRESYSSSSQSYLAVALQPAGNVTAVLRNKAGGWATNPTWAATVVNDDQWHQLTFVREGTSLHLYIDGSLEGSLTNISGTFLSNVPVRIGSYSAGSSSPSRWFDGQIDDMRMWDRALGASEVSTLYTETTVTLQLTDGMVAKYDLDSDASDSVGSNNGTVSGVAFSTAAGRSFASFDGTNDNVSIPHSSDFVMGSFSTAMWIKPSSLVGTQRFIGKGASANNWFSLSLDGSTLQALTWGNSGSPTGVISNGTVSQDTWHHVMLTYDNSTSAVVMYLDGSSVGTVTDAVFPGLTNSSPLVLGMNAEGNGEYYSGKIDDVRIWNRALAESEVANLYSSTKQLTDGMVAKYDLDSDVSDSVGSFGGTSHGGASFESDSNRSAMRLTSTGDYAQIPAGLNIGNNGVYTFSTWVKLDNLNNRQVLLSDHISGSTYPSIMIDVVQTSGIIKVNHFGSNSPNNQLFTSTASVTPGQWQLITITWDGSTSSIYLDGSLADSGAMTKLPYASWVSYRVGADTYPGQHVRGLMDDLRIWNRALAESEVATLHTETTVTYTPQLTDNLTSMYALTADVIDSQGNYNGTNVGVAFANDATLGRDVAVFAAGDYFEIPKGLENGIASSYTVSMWLNPDALQGSQSLRTLFMDGQSGSTYSALSAYILEDGRLIVWHGPANSASGRQKLESTAVLPVGSWTHVTFSWDGSSMSIYYDGVLDNSGAMTALPWDNIHPLRVGKYRTIAGYSFIGKMADFRFWTNRSLSASEVTTLYAEGAEGAVPESSGEALIDITYSGQLSGVRAFDHNGSVFCYITEESEAPSVYFGTDLGDFASFEQKTIVDGSSQSMSLEGKPMSLSMKSDDGSIYLGTRSGKLYHIAYDAGSSCVAKELFSGSSEVTKVHWDSHRSECLFEVDGVIRSVNLSDTVSVKHTLAAGSMVEDFKAAPSGVAIVFRKADFTFEVMFIEGTNWASPKASSQMIASVRTARDFEYNSDLDMWVAATDDGQTSVGDLL